MIPYSHPGYALQQVADRLDLLPGFHDLHQFLEKFVRTGIPLAEELYRGLGDEVTWKSRQDKLEKDTNHWLEDAHKRQTKYKAATRIWIDWTEEGGALYQLVKKAATFEVTVRDLQAELEGWAANSSFEERLQASDRSINRRTTAYPVQRSGPNASVRRRGGRVGRALDRSAP